MKAEYCGKSDRTEQKVEGYIIDIVKRKGLVEIQTTNFAKIKPKLHKLLRKYKITLVYNIPAIKWIIMTDKNGNIVSIRRSPKRGHVFHLFEELIYLTDIIPNPNLSLEVVMTEEEEIRQDDGKGSWRRRGISIRDRKLVRIIERIKMNGKWDYIKILPEKIKEPFSTKDISNALSVSIYLSRKILFCLKKIKVIEDVGKKGNLILYKMASIEVSP